MESSQERVRAERELVAFMQAYCTLIRNHIASISGLMTQTTEKVMDSVMKINSAKDKKKFMAESVLIKRGDGDQSTPAMQGDDQAFKNARVDETSAVPRSISTVKKLKEHMGVLEHLDTSMQDVLFKMVGALSADDVVGQRLEHVSTGLSALESSLTNVLRQDGRLVSEGEIEAMFAELVAVVRRSYTMPAEHEVMDEVFGKAS